MAKNFFQPVRMESQFVATKLLTVVCKDADANDVACEDGQLVQLGDFVADPVYKAAHTAAGDANYAAVDFNTRVATVPTAANATDICVIDLANVPTAIGGAGAYRMGVNTIGLTAEAGHWVRARKLVKDDVFATGADNCTGALTVNQFATPGYNQAAVGENPAVTSGGKWVPAAAAPAAGCYAKVINKYVISQGVDATLTSAGVQAYMLCVMAN